MQGQCHTVTLSPVMGASCDVASQSMMGDVIRRDDVTHHQRLGERGAVCRGAGRTGWVGLPLVEGDLGHLYAVHGVSHHGSLVLYYGINGRLLELSTAAVSSLASRCLAPLLCRVACRSTLPTPLCLCTCVVWLSGINPLELAADCRCWSPEKSGGQCWTFAKRGGSAEHGGRLRCHCPPGIRYVDGLCFRGRWLSSEQYRLSYIDTSWYSAYGFCTAYALYSVCTVCT